MEKATSIKTPIAKTSANTKRKQISTTIQKEQQQQQQLAKTATKINRELAMTKTKHGCQEIGKRF